MSNKKIERISSDVAEKLSTAQVVVSLSSSLRQLIDNSIDAGATIIDIKTKNNGFESIEVQDNGCGIEAKNFDALCKPHSTSKLTQFSDFDKLVTLGFRGEALNALCTVSSVTIFTRSTDSEIGTRLTFDHQGNITNRQSAARELGTTVLVERLFETLPVRRKELERSAKRDFMKLLTVIQSFAVLCPHIKILCTNIVDGKRNNVICTPGGNSTIRDVVFNLFGFSKSSTLVEIIEDVPNEEIKAIHGIPRNEDHIFKYFKLRGFVSNCEHGSGRSASDRQLVYINNRPVDYTRVCSLINEVYKQFNKTQYPIIVLFIDVPPDKIDVNVTPDKKTVMLEKERHLLAVLRASMMKTFQKIVGGHSTVKSSVEDRRKLHQDWNSESSSPNCSRNFDEEEEEEEYDEYGMLNSTLNDSTNPDDDSLVNVADLLRERRKNRSPPMKKRKEKEPEFVPAKMFSMKPSTIPVSRKLEDFSFTMEPKPVGPPKVKEKENDYIFIPLTKKSQEKDKEEEENGPENPKEPEAEDDIEIVEEYANSQPYLFSDSQNEAPVRPQQKIKFSMKLLRETFFKPAVKSISVEKKSDVLDELTTEIRKEDDGEAERQLSRALQKSDFLEMKVVGQFNKGFIICALRSHLFIVDQHASDEKYNFEKLQSSAKLTKQPLFTPIPLNFGSVQEMIIRENLQIFQDNGFDFDFRENHGCLKTYLTARPEILSQQLSNTDLEEIVAVVSEFPCQMYGPVRIRNIFASRACRKSVMIGKPLNTREMTKIIRHLSKLDQPWNCPHGRPTIRHLVSLQKI